MAERDQPLLDKARKLLEKLLDDVGELLFPAPTASPAPIRVPARRR